MKKNELIEKLTTIFRSVFGVSGLTITESLTTNDVDNWDSLTHMILITEIETQFDIKFKLKELNKMKNVGDLLETISSKLSE